MLDTLFYCYRIYCIVESFYVLIHCTVEVKLLFLLAYSLFSIFFIFNVYSYMFVQRATFQTSKFIVFLIKILGE